MKEIRKETLLSIQKRLTIYPAWKEWGLASPFYYDLNYKWSWKRIEVPQDFMTDWASIPWYFHIFFTPMDIDTIIFAIIHDYLTRTTNHNYTRQQADEIWNEIMLVTWVNNIKRIMYFLWVRIGGWYARNKNRK